MLKIHWSLRNILSDSRRKKKSVDAIFWNEVVGMGQIHGNRNLGSNVNLTVCGFRILDITKYYQSSMNESRVMLKLIILTKQF
jgi:hypothetical protein